MIAVIIRLYVRKRMLLPVLRLEIMKKLLALYVTLNYM